MGLFDRYLVVDWSANGSPKTGKDSIWLALAGPDGLLRAPENPPTRHAAMARVRAICAEALSAGHRLFAGFDFPFGYPQGAALAMAGDGSWQAVWALLSERLTDANDNANNSYDLAAALNREAFADAGEGPFWGHPHHHGGRYDGLAPTKPLQTSVAPFRHAERSARGAKSLWQLSYNGSVGRQAITGMAHLERLRHDPDFKEQIAIWPFETGFADDVSKPITFAEVYPSLFPVMALPGEARDSAQVRMLAERFAALDAAGQFMELLERPADMSDAVADDVLREEGWIVGAGMDTSRTLVLRQAQDEGSQRVPTPHPEPVEGRGVMSFSYIRDPAAIYAASFAMIAAEVDLSSHSPAMAAVVTRLVHACGMTDIVDDLAFTQGAAEAGIAALLRGVPIWCDVEMVRAGIIARLLPDGCVASATLKNVAPDATGNTRSALAVDLWQPLDGSICVIGNAPTALFALLERIEATGQKPALIIGIPVGFVGAVESKAALAAFGNGVPFITVHGRRGGSAMAASVVNALATLALAEEIAS